MEVTHSDDHVTSAVIGGTDKVELGIVADPVFMQMLSANLYRDQILAVVRESITNGDDAHKDAGLDIPIEITLTDQKFEIRDFGKGIPHDQIGAVYGTYGASTKRGNGKATGGFGLGCKSPFAYTDSFQVTSCCEGVKTIYRMSKSDAEVGGAPSIIKIVSVPTTETGMTVSVNIKTAWDKQQFGYKINKVLFNGGINAKVNGTLFEVLDYSSMKSGMMLVPKNLVDSPICIKYGAVVYPLRKMDEFSDNYKALCSMLERLTRNGVSYTLLLEAPAGSLSLQPSREEISMQTKSVETVIGLLEKAVKFYEGGYEQHMKRMHEGVVREIAADGKWNKLLAGRHDSKSLFSQYYEKLIPSTQAIIAGPHDMAAYMLSWNYPGNHMYGRKDAIARLTLAAKCPDYPHRGQAGKLAKAISRSDIGNPQNTHKWFVKEIVAPIYSVIDDIIKTTPTTKTGKTQHHVNRKRLYMYNECSDTSTIYDGNYRRRSYSGSYPTYSIRHMEPLQFIGLHRKIIYLTHDTNKFSHKIYDIHLDSDGPVENIMLYEVQRSKAAVAEATVLEERLTALGFQVRNLLHTVDKREPPAPRGVSKVKKEVGLIPLSGIAMGHDNGGTLRFKQGLLHHVDDRIAKPEVVTEIYNDKSGRNERLPGFNAVMSKRMYEAFGDKIAVVRSCVQKEAWLKKGAKELHVYTLELLVKHYANPANLTKLQWNDALLAKICGERCINPKLADLFFKDPVLAKAAKVKQQETTKYDKIMQSLFQSFADQYDSDCFPKYDATWKAFEAILDESKKVVVPKEVNILLHKLQESVTLRLIDTAQAEKMLSCSAKPSVIQTTQKLLIKGLKG